MGILCALINWFTFHIFWGTYYIYQLIHILLPWLRIKLISWVFIMVLDMWDTSSYMLSMCLNLGLSQCCPRLTLLSAYMTICIHNMIWEAYRIGCHGPTRCTYSLGWVTCFITIGDSSYPLYIYVPRSSVIDRYDTQD